MKAPMRSVLISFGIALAPACAMAYIGTPFISPTHPTSTTPISVHIPAGVCHGFTDEVDEAVLTSPAPGHLRLQIDGVALSPGHPFCVYPEQTYRFDIGALAAGEYVMDLVIFDEFSVPVPTIFASVSFVVGEPASVPANSRATIAALITLLVAAGWRALRVRSQRS